jgi:hypothetical protein
MKFQFSTSTLLLATSFVAICICGLVIRIRALSNWVGLLVFLTALDNAYFWAPLVFAAYSIGRRKLTWQIVVSFAIVESALVAFVVTKAHIELAHYFYPGLVPK